MKITWQRVWFIFGEWCIKHKEASWGSQMEAIQYIVEREVAGNPCESGERLDLRGGAK